MNGDAQQIFNKLIELETKQEERHGENKSDLKVLFSKVSKLDNLPCEVHIERLKGFAGQLAIFKMLVIGTIFGGIVLGLWVHVAMGR